MYFDDIRSKEKYNATADSEIVPGSYLDLLKKQNNKGARTENDAPAYKSSGSALMDFFALGGGCRFNDELVLDLFKKAFAEDNEKAIKILFYFRDVRGGQGERNIFRVCMRHLSDFNPKIVQNIAKYVSEYGRWDDLLAIHLNYIAPIIKNQLEKDEESEEPSLLAKWLPRERDNGSRNNSNRHAVRSLAEALGMNPQEYRQKLVRIRKKINLLETALANKDYESIDYSKIPSKAGLRYRSAFLKNDKDDYNKFLEDVKTGDKKINVSTLYPYELYDKVKHAQNNEDLIGIDEMWDNLPDYAGVSNSIVVADVSGSMHGRPMSISVSLALYFAERNKGVFKDHFITFSGDPKLQKVQGNTLKEKMDGIEEAEWEANTDVNKVFDLLLETAVNNGTKQEEMPSSIIIISDMQFDNPSTDRWGIEGALSEETNFEVAKRKFESAGYDLPSVVFWNVDAREKNFPVTSDEQGTKMVSGSSPTTFKFILDGEKPEDVLDAILESDRYKNITIQE